MHTRNNAEPSKLNNLARIMEERGVIKIVVEASYTSTDDLEILNDLVCQYLHDHKIKQKFLSWLRENQIIQNKMF